MSLLLESKRVRGSALLELFQAAKEAGGVLVLDRAMGGPGVRFEGPEKAQKRFEKLAAPILQRAANAPQRPPLRDLVTK